MIIFAPSIAFESGACRERGEAAAKGKDVDGSIGEVDGGVSGDGCGHLER